MASVTRSIVIHAPLPDVFAYMENPDNQPEISSDATTVESVEKLPSGGISSRYTYEVAGMSFSGKIRTIDYVANDYIKFALSGGLDGTILWKFDALEDGVTQMTYSGDYDIDVPLIGGAISNVAAEFNAQEIETQLANLKAAMESK
jgi:uncharacterized membrane protein